MEIIIYENITNNENDIFYLFEAFFWEEVKIANITIK